jgi:predicted CXXCH cytochrome family protein
MMRAGARTGLSTAACASLIILDLTNVGFERNPTFLDEATAPCTSCHFDDSMVIIEESAHRNLLDPDAHHGCQTCHGPGSFHASKAHGGEGKPPLIDFGDGPHVADREIQVGTCMTCHDGNDPDLPPVAFSGTTHDLAELNCSTCHLVHVETEPLSEPAAQAEICFKCHEDQRTGHRQIGRKPLDFTQRACNRCHKIHKTPRKADGLAGR